jgi:hypothetical protein
MPCQGYRRVAFQFATSPGSFVGCATGLKSRWQGMALPHKRSRRSSEKTCVPRSYSCSPNLCSQECVRHNARLILLDIQRYRDIDSARR